jgi:hypothetical protein
MIANQEIQGIKRDCKLITNEKGLQAFNLKTFDFQAPLQDSNLFLPNFINAAIPLLNYALSVSFLLSVIILFTK